MLSVPPAMTTRSMPAMIPAAAVCTDGEARRAVAVVGEAGHVDHAELDRDVAGDVAAALEHLAEHDVVDVVDRDARSASAPPGTANLPRSNASKSTSEPLRAVPMAVRAAETMTASPMVAHSRGRSGARSVGTKRRTEDDAERSPGPGAPSGPYRPHERPDRTTKRTPDAPGADAAPAPAAAPTPASIVWLRRSVVALGVVTGDRGRHRDLPHVPLPPVAPGSTPAASTPARASSGIAQTLHTVGAYAFVALVLRRRRPRPRGRDPSQPRARRDPGQRLRAVPRRRSAFLVTGLQLPWRGLRVGGVGVQPALRRDRRLPPGGRRDRGVGNGDVTPARYETVAWIHIAGLPVFAVFAAWWMLGAVQSSRQPT